MTSQQKSAIVRMPRLTRQSYRVHLSCGHAYTVQAAEILRLQLFIGKQVECETCQKELADLDRNTIQ